MLLAVVVAAQEEPRVSVYLPNAFATVPVRQRDGRDYVDLGALLQPLGEYQGRIDGDKWKLRTGNDESQFQANKNKAKVRGKNVDLGQPFLLDNGSPLAPVSALPDILGRLLGARIEVRDGGRRLLSSGVATTFTADFQANPSRLVLHFSKAVNPAIAAEPGRLRLTFVRDPVVGTAATQNFGDRLIGSASFLERNGAAELTVHSTAPLLATFADENRTITIAAAPQVSHPAAPAPAAAIPASPAVPGAAPKTAAPAPAAPARPRFLVVIDPGHGGDDRGALLAPGVEEKDLALAFALRLRAALERNGISSLLLRDADTAMALDQRAITSNVDRAAVFLSLHVGGVGHGMRLYTARVPEIAARPGALLPWESAQSAYLEVSRTVAGSIAAELSKKQIEHAESSAQMRPLANVTAAALAVEFLPNEDGLSSLASAQYQQTLCAAIADGISAVRSSVENRP